MDTNLNLNLFLVIVLAILYCFKESDLKNIENFENNSKNDFQDGVTSEEEKTELELKFENYEKRYRNKKNPKNDKMKEIQMQLVKAQNEAELAAKNATSNNSNKKKKVKKDRNTIIPSSGEFVKKFNKGTIENFVESENFESENANYNILPQIINNTRYGLFNKHNLPPSSRPNVIDIFDSTESTEATDSIVEEEILGVSNISQKTKDILTHKFKEEGNIFIPNLTVS